jgi:hypothetical protein
MKNHLKRGSYDFLIIKAGLGTFRSPIFDEQKQNVELNEIPFATYHLPDPEHDMRIQAQKYVDWVGTQEPAYIVDIESPGKDKRPPSRGEVLRFIDELVKLTNKQPILYSRVSLLNELGLLNDAKQFRLWIAQYPWDISKLPSMKMQYQYFHDFTRDFSEMLPPAVHRSGIADNVILWQFSEKGNGPYYIYNPKTAHPKFTVGMKQADLNISIKGRDEFMEAVFGGVPANKENGDGDIEAGVQPDPTYPGITNQDLINLIYTAAGPFTDDPWVDWIVRANLENLAIQSSNRVKPYTGLKIEDIPSLTSQEKSAFLAVLDAQGEGDQPAEPTYQGLTNQDMINLIYTAARPLTDDPWMNWIVRAKLDFLAVPSGNRRKPYTGPKVENLPNLTTGEKSAILALL